MGGRRREPQQQPPPPPPLLLLLLHTMTITEAAYVVEARVLHALHAEQTTVVHRQYTMRVHPSLRRDRKTMMLLRAHRPDLRTLLKRNAACVKHHLRAIHVPSSLSSLTQKKIEDNVPTQAVVPTPMVVANNNAMEKKAVYPKSLMIQQQSPTSYHLTTESGPNQTVSWLTTNRFEKYLDTFCSFSGSDMLRMTREDLIEICGQADGIRLYNSLHLKSIAPKLKVYVCREKCSVFNAIFLSAYNNMELVQKLAKMLGLVHANIRDIYLEGPHSIHVQLTNDVLSHVKDETMFHVEVIADNKDQSSGSQYVLLLKQTNKS